MSDKDNSRFKIRFDEDMPAMDAGGDLYREVEDLRLRKLRRKTNLMTILIPGLIGLVLIFGYLDLRNRYDKNFNAGSSEMQSLSKALESKFSSLSIRQAKLESMLPEKLAEIEKATVALKIKLQQAETLLADNMKASKTGTRELQNKIEALTAALAPVKSDVKKIDQQMASIENKFSKELSTLSAGIDSTRAQLLEQTADTRADLLKQTTAVLEKKLNERLDTKLDKKMFDLAIKHQEKLELMATRLSEQLLSVQKKLSRVEELQSNPAVFRTTPQTESTPASRPAVPKSPAPGKPNGIIEKDLR